MGKWALRQLGLAVGAAAFLMAGWASAQDDENYEDLSGSEIVALLEAHGYDASLTTDGSGDPFVTASADGLRFQVATYDCNKSVPRRCRTLQLSSTFALTNNTEETDYFEAMNDFNRQKVYGRAFINEDGDAAVDFTINLSGGVSASNLMDNIGTWKTYVLDVFVDYLGWTVS